MSKPDIDHVARMIETGKHMIPDHMWGAVERYFIFGFQPGSFLTAVLSNDLREAFARADDENAALMHSWVKFLYNYAPSGSWGSPEKFSAWLDRFNEKEEA